MTIPPDQTRRRIYFDHAATGWPKPTGVVDAVARFMNDNGAAAGRGAYGNAQAATEILQRLRRQLANIIGSKSPSSISFHSNGTAALNAGLQGLCRPGDHIVTTASDHNSVLRPIDHLRTSAKLDVTVVPADSSGRVSAESIIDATDSKRTRMVVLTGASNVTGVALPIAEVGKHFAKSSTLVFCDAAQTLGWLSIDVAAEHIDILAAPGHKASGGPLGTAMLYVDPKWHHEIQPTIFGGTGSQSEQSTMPQEMPAKLEAGNANVPALAGWSAALETWQSPDTVVTDDKRKTLCQDLVASASDHPGLNLVQASPDVPIVSVHHDELDATELAMILDSEFGIEARAGRHCSAAIHRYLGSPPNGLLRFSAGPDTTDANFESLRKSLETICQDLSAT